MTKKILTIILAGVLLIGMPTVVVAGTAIEIIEQEVQQPTVTISGNTLHVVGANDQVLQIYNVAGVCVMSFRVEGPDRHYELNLPKGCYIIKVGKTVRKISVK
jgi:hypothetical protein